ncbi:hypothetical protein [Streptomyces sp. NPDC002324]
MTAWSWAEISGAGGSTSYDRKYAERRSRSAAPRVSSSDYADHYAEKAAAREREQRRAQEDREWTESSRERDERELRLLKFRADDPEPWPLGLPIPGDPDNDISEASTEQQAWENRRDQFLQRAEGEELAARISRR